MKQLIKYAQYCWCLCKYISALIITMIMKVNQSHRNIWLIAERGTDARDNGFALFKYIRQNHPEIKIYYVIEQKSADYEKVVQIGATVERSSFRHYVLFALSSVKISTHIMGYAPNITLFSLLERYVKVVGGIKIFLQHGVIKDDIPALYADQVRLDLFVCGAQPEYDFVRKKFGFNEDVVKYLGLARFDSLYPEQNGANQVLLMPTWRMMHNGINSIDEFKNTAYFKKYQALIDAEPINQLLAEVQCKLIFYPHYEVQKYIECFTTKSEYVTIAKFADYDVQALLRESKVLITDYSSVFFDFAYLRKPVLYYHFDYEAYRKSQYQEGYFDYRRDGFGPVCQDFNTLIAALKKVLLNDSEEFGQFQTRINTFFPIYDQQNCARIFNSIQEKVNETRQVKIADQKVSV